MKDDDYDYFLGESPPGPHPMLVFFLVCVLTGALAAAILALYTAMH